MVNTLIAELLEIKAIYLLPSSEYSTIPFDLDVTFMF